MFASTSHFNLTSEFLSSQDMDLVMLYQSTYSSAYIPCVEVQVQCNKSHYFQWLIDWLIDTLNLNAEL